MNTEETKDDSYLRNPLPKNEYVGIDEEGMYLQIVPTDNVGTHVDGDGDGDGEVMKMVMGEVMKMVMVMKTMMVMGRTVMVRMVMGVRIWKLMRSWLVMGKITHLMSIMLKMTLQWQ